MNSQTTTLEDGINAFAIADEPINMIDHGDTSGGFGDESNGPRPSIDDDRNQEATELSEAQQSTHDSLMAMGFEEGDCRSTAQTFGPNVQGAIDHILQGGSSTVPDPTPNPPEVRVTNQSSYQSPKQPSYRPRWPEDLERLPEETRKLLITSYKRSQRLLISGYSRLIGDSNQYIPDDIQMQISLYFNLNFFKFKYRLIPNSKPSLYLRKVTPQNRPILRKLYQEIIENAHDATHPSRNVTERSLKERFHGQEVPMDLLLDNGFTVYYRTYYRKDKPYRVKHENIWKIYALLQWLTFKNGGNKSEDKSIIRLGADTSLQRLVMNLERKGPIEFNYNDILNRHGVGYIQEYPSFTRLWMKYSDLRSIYRVRTKKVECPQRVILKNRWVKVPDDRCCDRWVEVPDDHLTKFLVEFKGIHHRDRAMEIAVEFYDQELNKWPTSEYVRKPQVSADAVDQCVEMEDHRLWTQQLKVGDIVDVKDKWDKWYEAVIRRIFENEEKEREFVVHYIGWNVKWDEKVSASDTAIVRKRGMILIYYATCDSVDCYPNLHFLKGHILMVLAVLVNRADASFTNPTIPKPCYEWIGLLD